MKQTEKRIRIRDLAPGFTDDPNHGCWAMGGRLCCRPDYQREFVYPREKQDLVVDTILSGMPLGVMYWMEKPDGTYELMDGQQRTLSILAFCGQIGADGKMTGKNSINWKGKLCKLDTLEEADREAFLDYELLVYACSGTESERRDWFRRINIAGMQLTDQEILNSVYAGRWCTEAKKFLSRNSQGVKCPAERLFGDYIKGDAARQEILALALNWAARRDGLKDSDSASAEEQYMSLHQNDADADDLINHFKAVADWAMKKFVNHGKDRIKLLQAQDWGRLYLEYGADRRTGDEIEERLKELILDRDLEAKCHKGLYEYVLSGEAPEKRRLLSFRQFDESDRRRKYEEQGHKCPDCEAAGDDHEYGFEEMEGDHDVPWSKGGKTCYENLVMRCVRHNRDKSDR